MQLRLVLFIVLSALMVLGYQFYFMPQPPEPVPQTLTGQTSPVVTDSGINGKTADSQTSAATVTAPPPSAGSIEASIKDLDKAGSGKFKMGNDLFEVEFSKNGAFIDSVRLKKFKGDEDKEISIIKNSKVGALIFPFTGGVASEKFEFAGKTDVVNEKQAGEAVFKANVNGIDVEKKFLIKDSDYAIDMILTFRNHGETEGEVSPQILTGPGFYKGSISESDSRVHAGPIISQGGKIIREQADDLKVQKNYGADVGWVGFETKYFLGSVNIPGRKTAVGIYPVGTDDFVIVVDNGAVRIKPLETTSIKYTFYLGPKEYKLLEKIGLEGAIDFGWFGLLGKPLLVALNWIYAYLRNYGLSIILITIVIKILFLPLTQKSFASMQKMKTIQPQMKAVREKFKSDPQKMNQEMMALYKQHNVNPMGGCLPMLLQIPVFIAFYNVLLNAIELRGAHFFLWITDLSEKDPYYITPIIMGVTMLVQQKMTPAAGDPRQQQIMMIMPVVFTFMFMSFPVGLVIYWTVNNLLTIAQQYFMMGNKKEPEKDETGSRSSRKRRKLKKMEGSEQK